MKTLHLKAARICAVLLLVLLLIMQNGITLAIMRVTATENQDVISASDDVPDVSDDDGNTPVDGEVTESESADAPEDGGQPETEQPETPENREQSESDAVEVPSIMPLNLPLPLNPVGDFDQFVKSVKLVKGAGSASEMPGSFSLDFGETVYLRFDFHDLDGTELISIMSSPGPYEVEMPSALKGNQGSYYLSVTGSDMPLGTLTIAADGFASFIFNYPDNTDIFDGETAIVRNLWMDFACALNSGKIGDNDRTAEIVMEPYSDTKYTVSIPSRIPEGELSMSKTGSKNADGEYEWTVTVNTLDSTDERDLIYGPFTDTTGANHALYGDVHITGIQYDPDTGTKESVNAHLPTDTDKGFILIKDGDGFKVEFDKPFTGSDPITVTYKTRLTDSAFMPGGNPVIGSDETVTLRNDAEVEYGNEGKSVNASWPLAGENVSLLAKGGEYDYANKLIKWTVTVDTLGQDYEHLILHDQMADPLLKIDQLSVKVNGGAPAVDPAWTTNADGTVTMVLPIWQDDANLYPGKTVLTITYVTGIPDGYIDFTTGSGALVDNIAWLDFGWKDWVHGDGTGTVTKQTDRNAPFVEKPNAVSAPVRKEALSYNPSTRRITWKITVNSNYLELFSAVITETVGSGQTDLQYVDGSFNTSGDYTGAFSYDLTKSEFYMPTRITEAASFCVTTLVDDTSFLAGNAKKTFYNTAVLAAKVDSGQLDEDGATIYRPVTGNATASITPNNNVLSKSGKYDYSTHQTEWTILVNADRVNYFPAAVVTDVIADTQALVDDSFSIIGGTYNLTGANPGTAPISISGKTLTFALGDLGGNPNGSMVTIKYKTTHTGLANNTAGPLSFTNSAKLEVGYSDGIKTVNVGAEAISVPLIVLKKSVLGVNKPDPSVAVVTYQVLINQSNVAYNSAITLADTVTVSSDYGADVDPGSVLLYDAVIEPDGTFKKINPNNGSKLTSGFTGNTFTVTIPDGKGACILEYDVLVWHKTGGQLTGNIGNSISGTIGGNNFSSTAGSTSLGAASGAGGSLDKYLKVQITKKDEKQGASVQNKLVGGAEFGLYLEKVSTAPANNASPIATAKTGADGIVRFNLLMPSYRDANYYFIKEISAPTGYEILNPNDYIKVTDLTKFSYDGTARTYSIELKNNRTLHNVTFSKVYLDADGSPVLLPGATFEITADAENGYTTLPAITETPAGSGIFTITDLKWGTYTIKEKTTPTNYVPNGCTYKLEVSKTGAVTIAKNNDGSAPPVSVTSLNGNPAIVNEKGSVTITKTDPLLTGSDKTIRPDNGLIEAEFKIYLQGSDPDTPIETKSTVNGVVKFRDLDWGKTYVVEEVTAPTGYKLDAYPRKTFSIGPTEPDKAHYSVTWDNERDGMYSFSFLKHIQDYSGGAALSTTTAVDNMSAARFSLYEQGSGGTLGTPVLTNISPDLSGRVVFTGITFGKYYIAETVAHTGYALPKAATAPTMEVDLSRSPSGAATVKITDMRTNTVIVSGGADNSGVVQGGTDNPFINKKGSYTIKKTDNLYTNITDLAGAVFDVTNNAGEPGFTVTTGTGGIVKVDGLTPGVTYTFTETAAPNGYAVSNPTPVLTFTPSVGGVNGTGIVDGGTDKTFPNNRAANKTFSFTKFGQNGNKLQGAKFELKFKTVPTGGQTLPSPWANGAVPSQTATSDGNGIVTFSNLPYGEYVVTETAAPEGYSKNSATIEFSVGKDGSVLSVVNLALDGTGGYKFTNYLGSFTVTKLDAVNSGKISGVKFALYEYNGSTYDSVAISPDTTGLDGRLTISSLFLGRRYQLREASAPVGYKSPVSGDYIDFTLTDAATVPANPLAGYDQYGDYKNYRDPIYSFGFIKQDDHGNNLGGATFGLYNNSTCTQAITGFSSDGAPEIGGTQQITATSAAISGEVKFGNLPFGTYYVKEISAPTGGTDSYVESDIVLAININNDGTYDISDGITNLISITKGVVSSLVLKNELLGSITVVKQDRFGKKLQGVSFTLNDTNGSISKTDTTGADGTVKFSGLPLGKIYTITENSAPAGYELPNPSYITVQLEYSTGRHATQTVYNERIEQYSLDFLKQDPFGRPLEHAIFGIMHVADDAAYSQGMALTPDDTAESDQNGKVQFDNLIFGRFFVWEITPPYGYALSDTVLQADISSDGNNITITRVSGAAVASSGGKTVVINDRGKHSISFDKIAQNTASGLSGAVFTITPTADSGGKTVTLPSGTANTASSDAQGKVTFTGIPFGAYLISEVSAPRYYVKCVGSFKAEIDIDGKVTFSSDNVNPDITIATNGSTVSITNAYSAPPASGGSGGGSGSGSNSSGHRDSDNGSSASPQATTSRGSIGDNLAPFFPSGSTVTVPVIVQQTGNYTISSQTIATPKGESYDTVIVAVSNQGGAVIGEIAPPPPKEGYEFAGWYIDPEMTILYDPSTKIPQGTLRVYAKWYLSASDWSSDNPATGHSFPYKLFAGGVVSVLLAMLLTRPPFKKRDKTSVH